MMKIYKRRDKLGYIGYLGYKIMGVGKKSNVSFTKTATPRWLFILAVVVTVALVVARSVGIP